MKATPTRPGDEFQAGTSVNYAATWHDPDPPGPDFNDEGWLTPGGDPFDLLASQAVTTTGVKTLSARPPLRELRREHAPSNASTSESRQDGFVLRGPESSAASSGVQIASRESDRRPARIAPSSSSASPSPRVRRTAPTRPAS